MLQEERKIETFSFEGKLKEFVTSRHAIKDWVRKYFKHKMIREEIMVYQKETFMSTQTSLF